MRINEKDYRSIIKSLECSLAWGRCVRDAIQGCDGQENNRKFITQSMEEFRELRVRLAELHDKKARTAASGK